MRAYVVAAIAATPLIAPEVWSGFRLALPDASLAAIAITEQPLTGRSPGGIWAMALALAWFALACWQRRWTWWEPLLVVVGGAAVLARAGNAWLFALAMAPALGRQIVQARPRPVILMGVVAVSAVVALATLAATRPPELPSGARDASASAPTRGAILADWRWASQLQRDLGGDRHVLPAGGLGAEPGDFWADYVRILQGHERWDETLQRMNVDLLVVDSHGGEIADLVRSAADWRVTYDANGALVAERSGP
jgi:hypothetical protein